MAAGTLGVHDGIEAEVDLHHDTFARNVAIGRASRIQLNRPGHAAFCHHLARDAQRDQRRVGGKPRIGFDRERRTDKR